MIEIGTIFMVLRKKHENFIDFVNFFFDFENRRSALDGGGGGGFHLLLFAGVGLVGEHVTEFL